MSSWAWKSKQPSMAPHKHQVRREAQVCWEGRAGARDSAPEAAVWEKFKPHLTCRDEFEAGKWDAKDCVQGGRVQG